MAHINHVIYWRGGRITVETVDDDATSGNERMSPRAPARAYKAALALHAKALTRADVSRSVVLLVQQGGRGGADVIAAARA